MGNGGQPKGGVGRRGSDHRVQRQSKSLTQTMHPRKMLLIHTTLLMSIATTTTALSSSTSPKVFLPCPLISENLLGAYGTQMHARRQGHTSEHGLQVWLPPLRLPWPRVTPKRGDACNVNF